MKRTHTMPSPKHPHWPLLAMFCTLLAALPVLAQNQVTTSLNLPEVLTADVAPGATGAAITFDISAADSFSLNLIVPVDGASFSLLNPGQSAVLTSADASVEFMAGVDNIGTEDLPGGVFNTQPILNPADGTWTINISFPAAPEATVIVATILVQSDLQVGLLLTGDRFVVGQEVPAAMIVLDAGVPILGLSPELVITPEDPPGDAQTFTGLDDGNNEDGLANDGIYTAGIVFDAPGVYAIGGTVSIPDGASSVVRAVAPVSVTVVSPPFSMPASTFHYLNPNQGIINPPFEFTCLGSLNAYVQFLGWAEGDAVVRVHLQSPSGAEMVRSARIDGITAQGFLYSTNVLFSAEDVLEELGEEGAYTFSRAEVFLANDEGALLGLVLPSFGSTVPISITDWCREGVEIGNPDDSTSGETLLIEPSTTDDYISSLKITFPVFVQIAGSYTFSFRVLGEGGATVLVVSNTLQLVSGANEVSFEVQAEDFLGVDGPYSVFALLALGPSGTGSLTSLGEPYEASIWQFLPALNGDLDNDGAIGVLDRDILLGFRNHTALNPGDRRDLNRDGKIDILDARALVDLRCGEEGCFGEGEGEGEGFKNAPAELTDRQKLGL